MSLPEPPSWAVGPCLRFLGRVRPGVRVRALRLDERQWAEYEAYLQGPPRLLWGVPVVKRP